MGKEGVHEVFEVVVGVLELGVEVVDLRVHGCCLKQLIIRENLIPK